MKKPETPKQRDSPKCTHSTSPYPLERNNSKTPKNTTQNTTTSNNYLLYLKQIKQNFAKRGNLLNETYKNVYSQQDQKVNDTMLEHHRVSATPQKNNSITPTKFSTKFSTSASTTCEDAPTRVA